MSCDPRLEKRVRLFPLQQAIKAGVIQAMAANTWLLSLYECEGGSEDTTERS